MVNNQSRVENNEWDLSVLLKRDPQLWWFFTLGLEDIFSVNFHFYFSSGPDQLFPADSYTTTAATGAVKLKIDERGMASIPPLSVPTLLQRTVARHMDHPALCVKRDGKVFMRIQLSL